MEVGIWLSINKERRIIGPSLIKGARDMGRDLRHPLARVFMMMNVWKGPGRAAPANPHVIP